MIDLLVYYINVRYRLGGVMVSVLASSAEGRGFDSVKPNTLKLVFASSPLSLQHLGVRAKTDLPRVRIMSL